jgi:uncharacterized protein (TIGR02300 family)
MSELGNKHECLGCSTKFYDLGRNELICPKCGENQKDLAAAEEGKTNSPAPTSKKPAKAAKKKKAKKAEAAKKGETDSEDAEVEDEVESPDEESADEDEE